MQTTDQLNIPSQESPHRRLAERATVAAVAGIAFSLVPSQEVGEVRDFSQATPEIITTENDPEPLLPPQEMTVTVNRPVAVELPRSVIPVEVTTDSIEGISTTTSTSEPTVVKIAEPVAEVTTTTEVTPEQTTTTLTPETQDSIVVSPDYAEPINPNVLEKLPEPQPITPEMDKRLAEDTVYFEGIGCSGSLIRDADGKPIGAVTAEHCGLRDINQQRFQDADGKLFISPFTDLRVMKGDKMSELSIVGTVSHVIVPKAGDLEHDYAVLVFDGEDPEAVYSAINEVPELKKGDTAVLSGWPVDQDNNNTGEMRRQKWSMTYLGIGDSHVTSGEHLKNIRFFALKSNEDGAECSFGASGSIAITVDGKQVGTLAIFDEFLPDTWQKDGWTAADVRRHYERIFGVDLTGYTNICGIAINPGMDAMDTVEVRPVYETVPDQDEQRATEIFYDETKTKSFIDGYIKYPNNKGGPGIPRYIDRPLLYIDEITGNILLYWESSDSDTGLEFFVVEADEIAELPLLRSVKGNVDNVMGETTGVIRDKSTKSDSGFVDEADQDFGGKIFEIPEGNGKAAWTIVFDEGKVRFVQVTEGSPPEDTTPPDVTLPPEETIPSTPPEDTLPPETTEPPDDDNTSPETTMPPQDTEPPETTLPEDTIPTETTVPQEPNQK